MPAVRKIFLIFAFVIAGCLSAIAAGPSLLFDPGTGEVLSQDRAGEPWYPASLTKLMTAYVVFQRIREGKLSLEQKVSVSELASSQPPSKIGLKPGAMVSVDFALQALLVYSANDMAYVLAEAAAPDVASFASEMNDQAHRLGMTGTHYVNPNGLFEPRQITTARDLAILVSAMVKDFPEYSKYFSQDYLQVGKRKLANRNSLLRLMPEADGMKTGFICNSGFNLVATATHDGHRLGAVILGASSGKHRADLAEMLLTDGFSRQTPARPSLQQIQNLHTGAIVPADMTADVCKQKALVTIASSKKLGGWGISFGNYEEARHADMALRGRLLSHSGLDLPGQPGVIRMPGKGGFAAIMWDLDKQESMEACASYRSENAPCEVLTPELFEQIAAFTPDPPSREAAAPAQGSDNAKTREKSSRRKKKKNKK